ncbi:MULTISPECIES: cation:proton antiporter [Corynebacterium]|uniref:cation:proton antiporter n=1 Tax=Corynebacterium TaxID=1716 RepID=UPI00124CDA2A|nr:MULTISPECIES: cation:proton antiporter [Corynebacterium]
MSVLEIICYLGIAAFTIALTIALSLAIRSQDPGTRALLADMVFYCMLGIYLIWTLTHPVSIAYEVAILASIMGALTTVSLARILSKGRR